MNGRVTKTHLHFSFFLPKFPCGSQNCKQRRVHPLYIWSLLPGKLKVECSPWSSLHSVWASSLATVFGSIHTGILETPETWSLNLSCPHFPRAFKASLYASATVLYIQSHQVFSLTSIYVSIMFSVPSILAFLLFLRQRPNHLDSLWSQ